MNEEKLIYPLSTMASQMVSSLSCKMTLAFLILCQLSECVYVPTYISGSLFMTRVTLDSSHSDTSALVSWHFWNHPTYCVSFHTLLGPLVAILITSNLAVFIYSDVSHFCVFPCGSLQQCILFYYLPFALRNIPL